MSEKKLPVRSGFVFVLLLLVTSRPAFASTLFDYFRNFDLNDYSLGIKYSVSQNPYVGTSNSTIVFPYLTTLTNSSFNDNPLFFQGENIGLRYVGKSDWELGVIGRVQTLGFGSDENDLVRGLEEPRWTIEAGPMIGWRRWPVHIQLRSYWDLANRHNATTSELEFMLPRQFGRGFIVPSVKIKYLSDDYSNYYYGVSQNEALPTRPAYEPGTAINTWVGFRLGYELTPHWLLSSTVGIEFLDSAVTNSPIVDKDRLWSASIGLAYNADLFQPREYDDDSPQQAIEIRVSAFNSTIDTRVIRDALDGQPGGELDLEDFLGIADQETIFQLDALYRIAYFHRFELGYFELQRQSLTTLGRDVEFGDETFVAGTEVETSMRTEVLRLAYSYSLMRDQQKELGVSVGLSFSQFEAGIRAESTQQSERLKVQLPLPTMGVFASVALGDDWRLSADIDLFALDFDHYDGYMTYVSLDLDRKFGDVFAAGIGYNFYGTRLESKNEALRGTLRIRHHGPKLYLQASF